MLGIPCEHFESLQSYPYLLSVKIPSYVKNVPRRDASSDVKQSPVLALDGRTSHDACQEIL